MCGSLGPFHLYSVPEGAARPTTSKKKRDTSTRTPRTKSSGLDLYPGRIWNRLESCSILQTQDERNGRKNVPTEPASDQGAEIGHISAYDRNSKAPRLPVGPCSTHSELGAELLHDPVPSSQILDHGRARHSLDSPDTGRNACFTNDFETWTRRLTTMRKQLALVAGRVKVTEIREWRKNIVNK